MHVKIITLLNGLIIMGMDVSGQQEKVVLQKPVQIVTQQNQQGQIAMGFVPYHEFTTEWTLGLPIAMEKIVHVTTPVPELLNEYNRAFGSGIEVVSAMPSILKP